jgi:hypothetical protein
MHHRRFSQSAFPSPWALRRIEFIFTFLESNHSFYHQALTPHSPNTPIFIGVVFHSPLFDFASPSAKP